MGDDSDPSADDELDAIIRRGHARSAREGLATWVPVVVGVVVFAVVMMGSIRLIEAVDLGTKATGRLAFVFAVFVAATVGGALRKILQPKPLE